MSAVPGGEIVEDAVCGALTIGQGVVAASSSTFGAPLPKSDGTFNDTHHFSERDIAGWAGKEVSALWPSLGTHNSRALEILEDLFDGERSLFPPDITSKDLVRERYQAFRSFRRTSDTRAAEMDDSSLDIDIVN